MARAKPLVQLFIDVVSPNSWFAFEALSRYQTKWDYDFEVRPLQEQTLLTTAALGIDQSDVEKAGSPAPESSAADEEKPDQPRKTSPVIQRLQRMQDRYARREFQRCAAYWGLPVNNVPQYSSMQVSSVDAYVCNRYVQALKGNVPPAMAMRLIRQLWIQRYVLNDPPTQPKDFVKMASKCVGITADDSEMLLLALNTAEVENAMLDNQSDAIQCGAFQLPWTLLTLETGDQHEFFGWEYLPIMADILDVPFEGPLRELADFGS